MTLLHPGDSLHRPYIPIPTTPHRHCPQRQRQRLQTERQLAGTLLLILQVFHTARWIDAFPRPSATAAMSRFQPFSRNHLHHHTCQTKNPKHWFTTPSSPHLLGSLTSSTVPRLVNGWRATCVMRSLYTQNLHRHPTLTAHRYHNDFKENDRWCITSYNAAGAP